MRGTKGGFFDRLIERLKIFINRRKKKKEKIIKEKLEKQKLDEKLKKEKEIAINLYLRSKANENKTKLQNKNKVINVRKIDKKFKNRINYEKIDNIKENKINYKTGLTKKEKVINTKSITFKDKKNTQKNKDNISKEKLSTIEKLSTFNKRNSNIKNMSNNKNNFVQNNNSNLNIITPQILINGIEKNKFNDEKIIKEIEKIIAHDKLEIEKIISELREISINIQNEKDLDKIKKVEERLKILEERINKILYDYELLKNKLSPNILLKMENAKLLRTIGDPKLLSKENLEQIINDYETKLDYYEEIIIASNLKDKAKEDTLNRKIVVIEHKNEFEEEKEELDLIISESNKLIEQYKLEDKKLKEISNKIDQIQINKTEIKYTTFNRILNKTGNFIKGVLGLPLIATFNPALIAVGSYLIGISIKNMRSRVSENEQVKVIYEPNTTYIEELKRNRYTMDDLERMINNNITDIKYFRQEYISKFGNYHNYSDYTKNLNFIEEIEKKLIEKQKMIEKQKEKIKQVENKQQKKLIYIKELNTK